MSGELADVVSRSEYYALKREVRELRALVEQLSRRRDNFDARAGAVFVQIHRYAHATAWSAAQRV